MIQLPRGTSDATSLVSVSERRSFVSAERRKAALGFSCWRNVPRHLVGPQSPCLPNRAELSFSLGPTRITDRTQPEAATTGRSAPRSSPRAVRSSGTRCPWRAPARSTEPGIASSSGSRPAAMSRCIELPSVSCAASSSAIARAGSMSLRALRLRRPRTPPRSHPPDRRAARASSESRRAARRRRWSCTRARSAARASTTSRRASESSTRAGTPACDSASASACIAGRAAGSALAMLTSRNGLVCTTTPGCGRSASTRIEPASTDCGGEALAQHARGGRGR